MTTVLALIVTLGILVTVHEYGHYWVARRCGVKVLRFSVGFGKPLYSWYDRHGTEFAIAAIPLGGYVKMLDARDSEVEISEQDRLQEFTGKSVWQRIAIVSAGPMANFLFAIAAYWILFMVGVGGVKPVVGDVEESSLAQQAGLSPMTVIESVDGQKTDTWKDVSMALVEHIGETSEIVIRDENQQVYRLAVTSWLNDTRDPDPLSELGIQPFFPTIEPLIEQVQPQGRAEQAGLQAGDLLISADGQLIEDWPSWVALVQQSPEQTLQLVVQRNDQYLNVDLTPMARETEQGIQGFIGASVQLPEIPEGFIVTQRLGPLAALWQGVEQTWDTISISLRLFGKMLTGQISFQNLSGPVSIAKMAGESATSGLEVFVGFLAFISISLGVFNLLPVPVLDGGHLMYYLFEVIRGKPLPERVQQIGFQLGAALLLMLMVFAVVNDFSRL